MLIFINKNENKHYIFIHIPKNSGKYIRQKIENDANNEIVKSYWDMESNLDLAHIPYMKKNEIIEKNVKYNFFAHTRCPYNRIISAFFYRNPNKQIDDFKNFVKSTLILYDFSIHFDYSIIHFYPQYLFICDQNLTISQDVTIHKLEDVENPRKYELANYFDSCCINIINKVYMQDFTTFQYEMINNI